MNMVWTGARCEFAVEMFFQTGESVIAPQRTFCVYFMLFQNDAVLDRIFNGYQY